MTYVIAIRPIIRSASRATKILFGADDNIHTFNILLGTSILEGSSSCLLVFGVTLRATRSGMNGEKDGGEGDRDDMNCTG